MNRKMWLAVASVTVVAACGSEAATSSDSVAPSATEALTEAVAAEPVSTEPATTEPATTEPPATEPPATDPPTTEPPATDPATTEPGEDEPAEVGDAARLAWATVFDSTVAFADKSAHLEDAGALEATVDAYASAGESFGGISLEPTAVAVVGASATVTYNVNFGENPAYTDQSGTITLVDGVWMVSRDEFCAFMSSARVSCS